MQLSRIKTVSHSNRYGFTLIELLVVISIISMLISILLPALAKARESSRSIQCGTNLHQMSFGQTAYEGDYGWFVSPKLDGYTRGSGNWWMTIRPYIGLSNEVPATWDITYETGDKGVMKCPSYQKEGREQRSYAMNNFSRLASPSNLYKMQPAQPWLSSSDYTVRSDSQTTGDVKVNASNIMLMSELGHTLGSASFYTHFAVRNGTYWRGGVAVGDTSPDFRHSSAKNTLFLDGHVDNNRDDGSMGYSLFRVF